jgi:hypothetical protein
MFMYWSNPRKTPTTFLFPLSLTAILISNFQAKRQNKDLELVKIKNNYLVKYYYQPQIFYLCYLRAKRLSMYLLKNNIRYSVA